MNDVPFFSAVGNLVMASTPPHHNRTTVKWSSQMLHADVASMLASSFAKGFLAYPDSKGAAGNGMCRRGNMNLFLSPCCGRLRLGIVNAMPFFSSAGGWVLLTVGKSTMALTHRQDPGCCRCCTQMLRPRWHFLARKDSWPAPVQKARSVVVLGMACKGRGGS